MREALGVSPVGSFKDGHAFGALALGESVVDIVGREEADAGVVVLGVVPGEEVPTVGAGVFLRAKAVGEIRTVLHGFEVPLGERIVSNTSWLCCCCSSPSAPRTYC